MADEALIRWEQTRREQLGGAIAFLVGLSSALLAFCVSLLMHDSVTLGGGRTMLFLTSVGLFLGSLGCSALATVTRLQDSRTTVRIIRARLRPVSEKQEPELQRLRELARSLGRWSWRAFYCQLGTLSIGAIFLLLTVYQVFQDKLFPPG